MKKKISVSIDEDLLGWVNDEVEKKKFASVSHAINLSLSELRKSMNKK